VRETTLQAPRSVKKEGEEVLQAPKQRFFPLQPMMKTMVRQAVPLQSMEVHGGTDIHMHPVEGTPRQSRWMPEGGCDSVWSLHWSRLLPGPADLWREEPMLEQVCWQDL